MVKQPPDIDPNGPGVEERAQLFHDFGGLLGLWSEFEIAVEMCIGRLIGTKPLHTSIVIGSLGSGTKINILSSLLDAAGDTTTMKPVKALISFTKRNALVHGLMGEGLDEEGNPKFGFFYRTVRDDYRVTCHEFTDVSFHQHLVKFRDLQHAALDALGFSDEELQKYGREARFYGEE